MESILDRHYIKKEINTTDEEIECQTCEGTGKEAFEDESYLSPAVKYESCEECHGEKLIENPNFEQNEEENNNNKEE